jgi:hypothetical protein
MMEFLMKEMNEEQQFG